MITVGTSAQLPGGGATGQLLAKNSGADLDAGWATVAGGIAPVPLLPPGTWLNNLVAAQAVSTSVQLSGPQCLYVPLYLSAAVSVTALAVGTSSGGAGTVYLALYPANASTGQPGTQLATGSTAMPGSSAVITITLAAPVTAPAGWCWIAVGNTTGSPQFNAVTAHYTATPLGAQPSLGQSMTSALQSGSAAPAVNPSSLTATLPSAVPVVYLKAAS